VIMISTTVLMDMTFPERLAALRKQRSLTQAVLADKVGITVLQIRRYESGASQPTLDVIRRIAIALSVSSDMLIFDEDERGPSNGLRYQFEAVSQLMEDEQAIVKEVLESLIIKYQTRRWDSTRPVLGSSAPASAVTPAFAATAV
jgi:transcriptional regulator with XRE-family HTH domain